jgi:hypothetical protein
VLPYWLDAGIGARALVDRMSMSLHLPPSLESHERDNRFGGAGVLAARLQRWHRIAPGRGLGERHPDRTCDTHAHR